MAALMAQQMAIVETTDLDDDERQMLRDPVELERKIQGKEQVVMRLYQDDQERHNVLDKQTVALANGLHVHKVAIGHARDSLRGRMAKVHKSGVEGLYKERVDRHHTETKLEQRGGAFAAEAGACLERDGLLQERADAYTRAKQEDVCHLYNALTEARNVRVESGRKMAEGVSSKLEEVREALAAERRIRQESEGTLLELFGQMGQRLDQELEKARAERLAATDRIVSVVEAASDLLHKSHRAGANKCRDRIEVASQAKQMASSAAELSRTRCGMQRGKTLTSVQNVALERTW